MAVAFQAAGTDVATVTTTLALVAPAGVAGDIFIANIMSNNNVAAIPPSASWFAIQSYNNTAAMRHDVFIYRAGDGDGAATFNFTVNGTTLSYGVITTYRGVPTFGSPYGASSQSANALADAVTYATITPRDSRSLIVACGAYNLNATTAGAMSGTNPTFTNRVDAETITGNTGSLFVYDGLSGTGVATGARTHATTSTTDAINCGVLIELLDVFPGGALGPGGGGAPAPRYPARKTQRVGGSSFDY